MFSRTRPARAAVAGAAALLLATLAGTLPAGAAAHRTSRVSLGSGVGEANDGSFAPSTSGDGRYVAFISNASNLVPHDINRKPDVFVRDTKTGRTTRVSVSSKGMQANDISFNPTISDDGRYVVFDSFANNLVPGDGNRKGDVFLHDRVTGVTERISRALGGADANAQSGFATMSGDGRYVAFESTATNLLAERVEPATHLYLWDRTKQQLEMIDRSATGVPGNGGAGEASLSRDGRFIAFTSAAANLVPGDTNQRDDVFLLDRQNRTITRVSASLFGFEANGGSGNPSISDDGRYVAFESLASNLLANDVRSLDHIGLLPVLGPNPHTLGDTNGASDIFVRDLQTGVIEMSSVTDSGEQGTSNSYSPSISADGTRVAFTSYARNFGPQIARGKYNEVFVRDRVLGSTAMASVDDEDNAADSASTGGVITADGKAVVFSSTATNLVRGDRNQEADIFVHR